MNSSAYTIIFEPAEEGGYNVIVPGLPGCFSQGETLSEAAAMAQDAIALWLEELQVSDESGPAAG